jgi:glycerophosphoryl diester phosphodiesterase
MYIEVAAHRGNVACYPENTMAAFRSAYEIGADMIELDLHMTKDGEIVIIHDGDLARTADVSGRIRDLTLAEILRADVGIKRGEAFRGMRVPTLEAFCRFAASESRPMQFNFEFKDYFSEDAAWAKLSADKIIETVDRYGLWERSFVNSFDGQLLSYVEEKYGGRFRLHGFYPYSILGEVRPKRLYCACLWKYAKSDGTPAFEGVVNPESDFSALKEQGVRPWVGASIQNIEDMARAASYGAELITSNEPETMIAALAKVGLREKE